MTVHSVWVVVSSLHSECYNPGSSNSSKFTVYPTHKIHHMASPTSPPRLRGRSESWLSALLSPMPRWVGGCTLVTTSSEHNARIFSDQKVSVCPPPFLPRPSFSPPQDLGQWLSASTHGLFNFHPNVPLELHIQVGVNYSVCH